MGSAINSCCGSEPNSRSQSMQTKAKQLLGSKYRIINLQKLKRKEQIKGQTFGEDELVKQISKQSKNQSQKEGNQFQQNRRILQNLRDADGNGKVYWYRDTANKENRILGQFNNFFNAFFFPYANHGDVLLVPDDIWLMISIFLSKYIDSNAEKLRTKFVTFQGSKKLTIYELANSVEEAEKLQSQWEYFFTEIIKQIQENTVKGTVQALSCNFSTTTQIYKLISASIIMSSFKYYFSYQRCIMGCGLNNIFFAGTREDWVKVLSKLRNLIKYDVDGRLKEYVQHVEVILKNFIDTFDNKPNVKWWNKIMTSEERRVGSGLRSETFVEGWILHFYGIYSSIEAGKIPTTEISVPISLVNKVTKKDKKLELRANWVSVSKQTQFLYKPDIAVCLVQKGQGRINDI